MTLLLGVTNGHVRYGYQKRQRRVRSGGEQRPDEPFGEGHDPRRPALFTILQVADAALDHLPHAVDGVRYDQRARGGGGEHVRVHATRRRRRRQHVQERAPLFRDPHHFGQDILESGGRCLSPEYLLDRRHDRQTLLVW